MLEQIPMQLMVSSGQESADLYISGDITKGFTFLGMDFGQESDTDYDDVVSALDDLPDTVREIFVHINSFGGSVAEGVAIYNALRSHKAKVTTVCEGFACSIASVVFMAGQRRVMRPASLLMLHNASMPASGDAQALRKAADDLDTITGLSKTAYLSRATEALTPELLDQVMDAETWVAPEKALEWGLATEAMDEDGDGQITQSAREAVMRRLTEGPRTRCVARFTLTKEQIDEVVERVLGEIAADGGEPSPSVAPCGSTGAEPSANATSANSRYARIFKELSIQ